MIGDQYVYAHITKFPKSIDEAKRRARERLLEMRERIITGDAKFDLLARIYSVDGSALHGGENGCPRRCRPSCSPSPTRFRS